MEKGFNDDELADIMSEIESLEQDFEQSTSPKSEKIQATNAEQDDFVDEQESDQGFEQEPEPAMEVASNDSVDPVQEPEQESTPVALDSSEDNDWEQDKVEPISEQEPEPEQFVDECDSEMNEVLDELSQMPVESIAPKHKKEDDNIHHFKGESTVSKPANKSQTAMSFHVEGDMKLELSFHIGDQFIGVNITEEGLVVGLDGGAKFTIPVNQQAHKKAA